MSETMSLIKRKTFTTRWPRIKDEVLIPAGTGGIITGWRNPTEIRVLLDEAIMTDGYVVKGWFIDLNLGEIKIEGHVLVNQEKAVKVWGVDLDQITEDGTVEWG